MQNPHYESDAQNWHIIGVESVSLLEKQWPLAWICLDLSTQPTNFLFICFQFTKFERRQLKFMRIYLKQPSPNWLEYNLRDMQVYLKKTDR